MEPTKSDLQECVNCPCFSNHSKLNRTYHIYDLRELPPKFQDAFKCAWKVKIIDNYHYVAVALICIQCLDILTYRLSNEGA